LAIEHSRREPFKDSQGNQHIGASATTKLNRKDFAVDGAPGMVGDEISITIDVEFVRPVSAD
jgi:polyisoprenoid-binding protein YceI